MLELRFAHHGLCDAELARIQCWYIHDAHHSSVPFYLVCFFADGRWQATPMDGPGMNDDGRVAGLE